jgi:hypothetical protein
MIPYDPRLENPRKASKGVKLLWLRDFETYDSTTLENSRRLELQIDEGRRSKDPVEISLSR